MAASYETLAQPGNATISIPIEEDAAAISIADMDELSIRPDSRMLSVDQTQKQSVHDYVFEKSPYYDKSRIVFLEVQFSLLDENNHPYSFKYFGGTAFAIDTHHVITALHVITPDPEWYKSDGTPSNAVWNTTLIKERDVSIIIPEGIDPHEYNRWSIGGSDYVVKFEDVELDIAVLYSSHSHLSFPMSLKTLGYGKSIYTVDIKNAFATKVFHGTCWLSDESEGAFYDTDCYANFGFSGGPVLGIHRNPFDINLIFLDRHAGLVGVLISDAGKAVKNIRNISRFVSLGVILDHLNKFYPNWWKEIKITRSLYDFAEREPSPWDDKNKEDETQSQHSPLRYSHYMSQQSIESRKTIKSTGTGTINEPPRVKNWKCRVYKSGLPLQYR